MDRDEKFVLYALLNQINPHMDEIELLRNLLIHILL
jgi:hypothetical protein